VYKSDPSIEQNMLVSKFLSSVGHELRSPLTSIMGFTSLILKGKTSEISDEQREQPTIVYESSEDLLDLINDVMDISTIEAGKNELVQETFLLDDVVNDVISKLKDEVTEKGLQCKVDILPGSRCSRIKQEVSVLDYACVRKLLALCKAGYGLKVNLEKEVYLLSMYRCNEGK